MQFSQPNFQPPGFNPCGQPTGFHASIPPSPNFTGYPDLIGEGNVITVTSPDGSPQLVFLPTVQWPQCRSIQMPGPQYYNPYFGHPHVNSTGAWLVRGIFNQTHPMFCHPFQEWRGLQYATPPALNGSMNLPPPPICMSQSAFPLKFHNDNCTSTSDLHYFIPKQFTWFRTANGSIGVQVEVPTVANAACNYETIQETNICNCSPPNNTTAEDVECKCSKESNNSRMSIDSTKSKHKRRKEKSQKSKNKWKGSSGSDTSIDSTKPSHKCKVKSRKQKRVKSTRSNHTCECKEQQADKSVVTYTDQGNYCAPDTGQETQTFGNPTSSTACNCDPIPNKKSKPKAGCSKKVCKSLSWDSVVSNRRRNRSDVGSCTCTSRSDLSDY